MFDVDAIWFEVILVTAIFILGHFIFGHFEEHTPKIKRIIKYILVTILISALSIVFGRSVAMIVLALLFLPVIYIHAVVLPKKGINGYTGEPKEKYYELRGWDKVHLKNGDKKKKNPAEVRDK